MTRFLVMVDDNFRYMDPEARWKQGEYATAEEAIAACKRIVDCSIDRLSETDPASRYGWYTMFGADSFIVVEDDQGTPSDIGKTRTFSAWDYAKERCEALAANPPLIGANR